MSLLENIRTNFKKAKNISIHAHLNPDADALGSAIALKKFIKRLPESEVEHVDIFVDMDEIPQLYMPMLKGVTINPEPQEHYDLAISVDCASLGRLGRFQELYESAGRKFNFDHHSSNPKYGDYNFVTNRVSSTCELLYTIMRTMNEELITKDIATMLYCGILTDTSCLTQGIVTARTYDTIKNLMNKGVDDQAIRDYFFKNSSKAKALLISKATKQTKFMENDRIAVMLIKNSDLFLNGVTYEDTLGIVDNISSIKSVDIAAVMIEKEPGYYHVSLRSRGEVNVMEIAQNLGGGGNNKNMAAFQFQGEFDDLKAMLYAELKEEIRKHPREEEAPSPFDFGEEQ